MTQPLSSKQGTRLITIKMQKITPQQHAMRDSLAHSVLLHYKLTSKPSDSSEKNNKNKK